MYPRLFNSLVISARAVPHSLTAVRHLLSVAGLLFILAGCSQQQLKPKPVPEPVVKATVTPQMSQLYGDAVAALQQQRLGQAEAYLEQLITLEPNLSAPYLLKGRIAEMQKDLKSAVSWYEESLRVNPGEHRALNQLAVIAREQGDFERAREYYQRAIDAAPDQPLYHRNYAILLDLYLGELEKALEHYELYQKLSNSPDEQVALWVVDLKRRIQ